MTFTKEDLKRVFWTGVQAGLAVLLTLAPGLWQAPNLSTAKAIAIAVVAAAVAAGLSALKNLVLADGTWAK
jgi:hypothetical protein